MEKEKEPPFKEPRGGAKSEARFYALAALAFALLLLVVPVFRAAREAVNASAQSEAPEATPKETPAPLPTVTPAVTEPAQQQSEATASPPPVFIETAVVVEGKTAGVLASREAAEELLHDVKAYYEAMVEGEGRISSSFLDDVELIDAPDALELTTLEALYETFVNGRHPLKVQTVLQTEATDTLTFKEETKRDDTLLKGLRVVKSLGHEGESSVISRVIYVNGKEKRTETDERTAVTENENRVILLGTLSPKGGEPGKNEGEKGKSADGLSFAAPAEGKPVSNFGRRNGGMHLGLDYELEPGSSVCAAEKGVVASVLVRGNYGLTVEIDHGNGFLTRYAHLGSALVRIGDAVEKGEKIALTGEETYGEKGNLHFELRIDGFAYNPRYYLP